MRNSLFRSDLGARCVCYAAVVALSPLFQSCSREPAPVDAGALPVASDKDEDGLLDEWEINGVDYTDPADGSKQRLDFKTMGASAAHKDVLLWVAWMQSPDSHTHRPDNETLAIVQRAFRAAPVTNLDGFQGINLHIVLARTPVAEDEMLGSGSLDNYDWSEFDAIKKKSLPSLLQGSAFFAVFGHNMSTASNSGMARSIPGRDFIVSLGGFTGGVGTRQEQAGTLMHELGHALGLRHGGRDNIHFKPNYVSVMNYSFQLNGIPIGGVQGNFDYSRFGINTTEPELNEIGGLSTDSSLARYGTLYYCCERCRTPDQPVLATSIVASRIDWNCDASFTGRVATDINRDKTTTPLTGASDWANLVLKPPAAGTAGVANVTGMAPQDELTPTKADEVPLFPVADVHARPIGNGVLVEWKRVPLDRVMAYQVYRGPAGAEPMPLAIVDNVEHPNFADVNPPRGMHEYSVVAIFVPHAKEPEPPPPAPPPLPTPPRKPGVASAGINPAFGAFITGERQIEAVRKAAPAGTAELETLGGVTPVNRVPAFARVLRQTQRSQASGVVVK